MNYVVGDTFFDVVECLDPANGYAPTTPDAAPTYTAYVNGAVDTNWVFVPVPDATDAYRYYVTATVPNTNAKTVVVITRTVTINNTIYKGKPLTVQVDLVSATTQLNKIATAISSI